MRSLGSGYLSQISVQLYCFDMRLMTRSECESTRVIVLVLLHRSASTSIGIRGSSQDPSHQAGSITVGRIQRSSQDAGSKERQVEGVSNWVLV